MSKRLFLNSKNLSGTRGLKELVLVEGENDIRLVQSFGIRDVIGVGTGVSVTKLHVRGIDRLTNPGADICVVFTASRAGRRFVLKIIETIGTMRSLHFAPLPMRKVITKKFFKAYVSHHLFAY